METGDLFGLHRRYRVVTEPYFVLVNPKVIALQGYDIASRRPLGEIRLTHRLFEDPTRIAGVRPYEMGDALNRLHWRATARTGVLQSKTYEPSCVAGATLVLDFHEAGYTGSGAAARSELAVTTVSSVANALCAMGEQIGFITNGRDAADRLRQEGWRQEFRTRRLAQAKAGRPTRNERLEPLVLKLQKGAAHFSQLLETLARLELTDGFSFPELILETRSRLPREATVIAVLPSVTEDTAIALGTLRRSGYSVTAVVIMFGEHEYFDWAQPPDWAGRLLAEGIDFRCVDDEASLSRLCAENFIR